MKNLKARFPKRTININENNAENVEKKNNKKENYKEIISMSELLKRFLNNCEIRGLTYKTIKTYKEFTIRLINYMENVLNIYNIKKIDIDIIEIYIEYLNKERKISKISINSTIRNVKPYFKFLQERGFIKNNPFDGINLLRVDKKRKINTLKNEQVLAILNKIDSSGFIGNRDRLIIEILYGTGIRIDETMSLKIKDLNFEEHYFYIESSKNREDSFVPIPKSMIKSLKKYMTIWLYDFSEDDYLFPNLYGKKLSPHTFANSLKIYVKEAEINIPVYPHLFRHSFAINYLMNGGDTASLRRMLRQKDLRVVEEYLNWLPENVIIKHQQFNPLDKMYNII
jgi:integrase/recombinase XerD